MKLNEQQQRAVETIEGPVLVVAGPGTGKTQLLAARVANILKQTDAAPENILCLTFTNDGARNMRERLRSLIGEASYKVTVGTYHEFGAAILRDYPEYFVERRYLNLIDDLKAYQIFNGLVEKMSYTNGLRHIEWRGVRGLISDVKRAALTPDALRAIAAENERVAGKLEQVANEIFPPRMPSKLEQALPIYDKWAEALNSSETGLQNVASVPSLMQTYLTEYNLARAAAEASEKTTPLNEYKASILARVEGRFCLKARKANERLGRLAEVYEEYNNITRAEGLYDYDDIILAAIKAISENSDLRAELQEQYQYVLLDEYQDTNAAQSKIVELLLDNPVWEGRPNVLAVGDDDQAIYAFQGALASNLTEFAERYRGVEKIYLEKNYRSGAAIVDFAANFRQTIQDGVFKDKTLELATGQEAAIRRLDFKSDVAERNWVAAQIRELLASGVPAHEIAVLARKNAELASVAKHLGGVKIRFDQQNDILTETKIVREFLDLCRLLVAITEKSANEDELAARVFYAERWKLPVAELYRIARVKDGWISAMLASEAAETRAAAEKVLELAGELAEVPLNEAIYEIAKDWQAADAELYELNSALLILQHAVSASSGETEAGGKLTSENGQAEEARPLLTLKNLVRYADNMIAAGLNLLDASPYRAAESAVSLLSAHKAKGLEFEYVFIIGAHNSNWVKTNSHRGSTLPPNLQAINPSGDRDDDRRRLLYVAATRAKNTLYITRARATFEGKNLMPIEYLDERDEDGRTVAWALPEGYREVASGEAADERPDVAVLAEEVSRLVSSPDLPTIAAEFTANYALSPSDLNNFIDDEYGGAAAFYQQKVLKMPSAPNYNMAFGTVVHSVLQDVAEAANRGERLAIEEILLRFRKGIQELRGVSENDRRLMSEQGEFVLPRWLAVNETILAQNGVLTERPFRREKNGVRLLGRIDRIEPSGGGAGRTVVDFKTGAAGSANSNKSHKARLQLYFYKILLEGTAGEPIRQGRVDFVSVDSDEKVAKSLLVEFEPEEEALVWQLIQLVWQKVLKMDFQNLVKTEAANGGTQSFREFLEVKIAALDGAKV
ncbi:MAG: ATP-dependent helicase [Candidatus Nomurabacteria bacterium]|jgi:DNA helicase-2/ATP-dependent DNA helicase PcrA|nr:ATP-dependent helicase [Candidatus Nomurabacteria bacterium]